MSADGPARTLWLGGAQWAGKTTVANILAVHYGLIPYAYDYHDARSHADRARAQPERYPHRHSWLAALERDPDSVWVHPSPEEMAESARASFVERFAMVLDDLRALPPCATVLAEGWGLRPELVAPLLASPRQALFLVPSPEFRARQMEYLPRAGSFGAAAVSDPERAQRVRLERDRLLAEDVVRSATRLGLRVLVVDGSIDAGGVARLVGEHFTPHLPRWLY